MWKKKSTWNSSLKNQRGTRVSETRVPSLRITVQLGFFIFLSFFFFFIFNQFFFYWASSSFWDLFLQGPCCLIFNWYEQWLAKFRPNQSTTSSLRLGFFFLRCFSFFFSLFFLVFEKNFTWVYDVLGFFFFALLGFYWVSLLCSAGFLLLLRSFSPLYGTWVLQTWFPRSFFLPYRNWIRVLRTWFSSLISTLYV